MSNQALQVVDGAQKAELALIEGDLAKLSPSERLYHYLAVCKSVGLNPATKPFQYLNLNGKTVLYATKGATDQLRELHRVSIPNIETQFADGLCIVTVRATDGQGRHDSDIGAVAIDGLKGEFRANALMKAVTKAKRRVTLSICGLGMLDESEISSIPDAKPVNVDFETGIILPAAEVQPAHEEARALTANQAREAFNVKARQQGFDGDNRALAELAVTLLGEKPAKWTAHVWQSATDKSAEDWDAALATHRAHAELQAQKEQFQATVAPEPPAPIGPYTPEIVAEALMCDIELARPCVDATGNLTSGVNATDRAAIDAYIAKQQSAATVGAMAR